MTEAQYRAICEACDRLLLAPDASDERTAIPWLHVMREHPSTLAAYEDLVAPVPSATSLVSDVARRVSWWGRQALRSLGAGRGWFASRPLPNSVDVLFVSHVVSPSQAGAATDAYFSTLPTDLVKRGRSVAVILLNHTTDSASDLAPRWAAEPIPRIVLANAIAIREELRMTIGMRHEARRLIAGASAMPDDLARRVANRAAREATAPSTASTLRVARQIHALVGQLRPAAIVFSHEGHAWERLLCASARRAHPSIRCIAYQHAIISRLQHAIRRSLATRYNPDAILTSGAAAKVQLEQSPGLGGIPVSVLGSDRAIRTVLPEAESRPAGCLVLPEGFESECVLLFQFALECAKLRPDVSFIWRLHPILSFERLLAQYASLRGAPANVTLSNASLEDDIAECRWALYRGTTAIVKAVASGLRPLYVERSGEMSIDTLYGLKEWKVTLNAPTDLGAVVDDASRHASGREAAQRYCENLFQPVQPDVLAAALS